MQERTHQSAETKANIRQNSIGKPKFSSKFRGELTKLNAHDVLSIQYCAGAERYFGQSVCLAPSKSDYEYNK